MIFFAARKYSVTIVRPFTLLLPFSGARWKRSRKALTPAFHFNILEAFIDVFNGNSEILLKKLEGEVGFKGFNVMYYMKLCALDNICG